MCVCELIKCNTAFDYPLQCVVLGTLSMVDIATKHPRSAATLYERCNTASMKVGLQQNQRAKKSTTTLSQFYPKPLGLELLTLIMTARIRTPVTIRQ